MFYDDKTCNQELPERWWKAQRKKHNLARFYFIRYKQVQISLLNQIIRLKVVADKYVFYRFFFAFIGKIFFFINYLILILVRFLFKRKLLFY
jgi:hypothetical protein